MKVLPLLIKPINRVAKKYIFQVYSSSTISLHISQQFYLNIQETKHLWENLAKHDDLLIKEQKPKI